MNESDGRRIKRSLLIKISSIRFRTVRNPKTKKIELLSEILEREIKKLTNQTLTKKLIKFIN